MTLKAILFITARFLSTLIGYYFATVVVLALAFPGVDKYQVITLSWIAGVIVAFYAHRNLLAEN